VKTLSKVLCQYVQPYQNRANVRSRSREIEAEMKKTLGLNSATAIRSTEQKKQLTEAWFQLALTCAKASVKYEAEMYRQRVKQRISAEVPAMALSI